MISPEEMRKPLRQLVVTFDPARQADVIDCVRSQAVVMGYASRVSSDPQLPNDVFLQLYRVNLKFIGYIVAGSGRLDLLVYRTDGFPQPRSAIDFAIGLYRDALNNVPSVEVKETVFLLGDSVFPPATGRPELSGDIRFPRTALFSLTDALSDFAESQRMAILFKQSAPDPFSFYVDIYREDLTIHASNGLGNDPMHISISKSGDRTVSDETIRSTFAALKQAVETVPGVTFTLKQ